MARGRYTMARSFKRAVRTGGDLTFTSTTFVDLDNALDLVLSVQTGDFIRYNCLATVSVTGASDLLCLDVAVVTVGAAAAATPLNYLSGGATEGLLRHQDSVAGQLRPANFSVLYQVASTDLTAGQVQLRIRGRGNNTDTKTIYADGTNRRFYVDAENRGPADLH